MWQVQPHSSDVPVELQNDDAAWDEAAMVCDDMFRDTITRLRDSPKSQLEVADEFGNVRYVFRLTAETFDK
jgi:hypothetical protein